MIKWKRDVYCRENTVVATAATATAPTATETTAAAATTAAAKTTAAAAATTVAWPSNQVPISQDRHRVCLGSI